MVSDGLTSRAATIDDALHVFKLAAAASVIDVGEPTLELDDIITDWTSADFDLARDTMLVSDGEQLVGWAQVRDGRADADVDPNWRGRGIGLSLLQWTERRALGQAAPERSTRVGQTVIESLDGAHELFERRGYERLWDSWVLRLPPAVGIETGPPPDGVSIRPFRPDEERRVHEIIDGAFSEWEHREPRTFEQWQAHTTARATFDPSLLLVATVDDRAVGACLGVQFEAERWVDQIAVVPEQRGRGIGRAMLGAMFTALRERSNGHISLNTDSRSGALGLYLDVGMVVEHTFTRWSTVLHGPDELR